MQKGSVGEMLHAGPSWVLLTMCVCECMLRMHAADAPCLPKNEQMDQ